MDPDRFSMSLFGIRPRRGDPDMPERISSPTADDIDLLPDELTRNDGTMTRRQAEGQSARATKAADGDRRRGSFGGWTEALKSVFAGIGILCILAQLAPQRLVGPFRAAPSFSYTGVDLKTEPLLRPIPLSANISDLLHFHRDLAAKVVDVSNNWALGDLFQMPEDLASQARKGILLLELEELLLTPEQLAIPMSKRKPLDSKMYKQVARAFSATSSNVSRDSYRSRDLFEGRMLWAIDRGMSFLAQSADMATYMAWYLRNLRNIESVPDHFMDEAAYVSHLGHEEVVARENATAAHVLATVRKMVSVPEALKKLGADDAKRMAAVAKWSKEMYQEWKLMIPLVEEALAEAEKNMQARAAAPAPPKRRMLLHEYVMLLTDPWSREEPPLDVVAHIASVRALLQELEDLAPRFDEAYAEMMAAACDDWPELEVRLQTISDAVDLLQKGQGWYRPLTPREFYCAADDVAGYTAVHFYAPGAIELAQSMDALAESLR